MALTTQSESEARTKNLRPLRLAFFSRGRGSGHAIPDMALMQAVSDLGVDVELFWISYGTGAETFRQHGHKVIDLGLDDDNPFLETQLRASRLLAELLPDLVVTHEEFSVLPAAKLFGIKTVCITDFFLQQHRLWMKALTYADEILFIDEEGVFDEPFQARGKVFYSGPITRPFKYARSERDRARGELGIPVTSKMLLVLPGRWYTESRAPLFELVFSAYQKLNYEKRLIWFAGRDYKELAERTAQHPDLIVKEVDWQIDRWMVAADLAVTKGTRKTAIELACFNVPSVSLSFGLNPIDDQRLKRIPTNHHVMVESTNPGELGTTFDALLSSPIPLSQPPPLRNQLLQGAKRLGWYIEMTACRIVV